MNTQYLQFMQSPAMMEALCNSSVSPEDARLRCQEYAKMFSRNDELKDIWGKGNQANLLQKTFSGYAETPLLSTQYFNASVASYVSSFAGYMSIERDFDQPNGLFYWFDVLGVSNMRTIIPNLGADNYQDIQSMGGFKSEGTIPDEGKVMTILGRKIIPGTVRVKLSNADGTKKAELIDNGQAQFMAVAGILSSSSINYLAGSITLEIATKGDYTKYELVGKEDVTGTPSNTTGAADAHANDKRFMGKMVQLSLATVPDMLVAEYNIASLGALKKATGSDMATFLFTKLRELYTKMINYKLVSTMDEGYTANDVLADLNLSNQASNEVLAGRFLDYRSRVDLFDSYMINVETALAGKAVKGVTTTAYIAGTNAANQFQKGGMIGKFVKNTKMTYINDLLGWYDGIPVLRSTDIPEEKIKDEAGSVTGQKGVFYAIHKTSDGQMAPLARGIYMPLTDTPTIGNYANPTQMAAGVYYQEGTKVMAPELVQKVEFVTGF